MSTIYATSIIDGLHAILILNTDGWVQHISGQLSFGTFDTQYIRPSQASVVNFPVYCGEKV